MISPDDGNGISQFGNFEIFCATKEELAAAVIANTLTAEEIEQKTAAERQRWAIEKAQHAQRFNSIPQGAGIADLCESERPF